MMNFDSVLLNKVKKYFLLFVLFLLLFTFFNRESFGQTTTWTAAVDNNWLTAGNWSNGVPNGTNVATFDATSTANCTINIGANTTIVGINMTAAYTGTVTYAPTAGIKLWVGTNANPATGTANFAGGTFLGSTNAADLLAFNANLTVANTFSCSAMDFRTNAGVTFAAGANFTPTTTTWRCGVSATSATFSVSPTATINNPGAGELRFLSPAAAPGGTFTISGSNFSVYNVAFYSTQLTGQVCTTTVNTTITATGKITDIGRNGNGGGGNTFTLNGSGTITTPGTCSITGSTPLAIDGSLTINVGSNLSIANGGNNNIAATNYGGTGTIVLNGTGAQTIYSHAGATSGVYVANASWLPNLTVANSNTATLAGPAGSALIVSRALTISNSTTLDVSASNFDITLKGNWTNNGTFTQRTGTVILNGSLASQAIGGTTATTFYDLTCGNSAAAGVYLSGNMSIDNYLTVNASTLLDLKTYTANNTTVGPNRTLTLNASSTMKVSGNSGGAGPTISGIANNYPANFITTTLALSSTVEYNADGAVHQSIFGDFYGNLLLSNGNASGNTNKYSNGLNVNGHITIGSNATLDLSALSNTQNIGGDWTNNGTFNKGTTTVSFNGSFYASSTISGTSVTNFFHVGVSRGTSISSTVTANNMTMTGQLVLSNGLLILNSTATAQFNTTSMIQATAGLQLSGGTLNTSGAANITNSGLFRLISGTANIGTANNDALNCNTGSTTDIQGGTLNVAGRFRPVTVGNTYTVTISGGTINTTTVSNNGTFAGFEIDGKADFTMSNGSVIVVHANTNASPIDLLIGSGTGTKSITGGTFQFGNASTNAAETFYINSSYSIYNLIVFGTNSPTARLSAALPGSNNITINSGGTLNANNLNISIAGTWTNNGTFTSGTGTVTFNGGSSQSITGTASTNFNNLTVNNAAGVVLNSVDQNVAGNLTLNAGDLDLNGRNIVLGSAGLLVGETNSKRVKGTSGTISITYNIGAPTTLNVGGLGAILTSSTNMGSTTVSRGHTAQTGGGNTSILRYYDITPTTNSGLAATLSFYYLDNELNGQTSNANMVLYRSTDAGVTWTNRSGTWNDNGSNDFVTQNSIDAFSRWTVSNSLSSPLPVSLLGFDAVAENTVVNLTWSTSSEQNNNYFTIERSKEGFIFEEVVKVNGAGNSSTIHNYSAVDYEPYRGVSYYRLKQTDYNGRFTYSQIVSVNMDKTGMSVYPNPANGIFYVTLSGNINDETQIVVRDVSGREYYSKAITLSGSNETIAINRDSKLAPGVYFVTASSDKNLLERKIVIK